ncbi:hypothetical protein BVG16_10035 [Paenibacillus selenitireducens]|uniref:Dockerin domain-containing protein n=1 Tax=Paenibacillus selenitireducens TaxID=1324314 RepID=A0A1T2XHN7_9BACL|nr:Ig-like domain-containing protein [Paenibacillus selenitireducens]OPA79409.1 hypothetical protein BVG16_10035 [Paenibacillus selenitireducens]
MFRTWGRTGKTRKWFVAWVVTGAAVMFAFAATASAETPKGDHQPYLHGYNVNQLKGWSPETDRFAKFFRSRIPLAERIPAFAATQANPALSAEPQVMNLSADYDKEAFFEAYRYNDSFSRNLLNFWQYTDIYGSWHGLPVDGSSETQREFGVINLPNPAYTDAAHKNGVLSLGGWFWPRAGQNFTDWVEKKPDGSFPVADKMIEMAEYFGFDGYFINQEASISSDNAKKLMEMLKYMHAKAPAGFHLQWYDSLSVSGSISYQNGFNDRNAPWIVDNGVPVNNSIFMNYAWNDTRLTSANTYAKSLGLDPYKVLFAGTENDKYGYNPPYDPRLIFPQGKPAKSGWALFGTDMVWNKAPNKFDPNAQDEVFRRERVYWSGPNQDPTRTGRTLTTGCSPYPDAGVPNNPTEYRCWDGVAHFIPERSVIGSYPFVTNFNTGHGTAFFLNGEPSSAKEWNNAGIQDILPSWQWWAKSSGAGNPLSASFDYTTAYDGGSSLKVSGTLDATNPTDLRLYKTKLNVTQDVNLSLTYKVNTAGPTHMKVGLIFEDAPNQIEYVDVGSSPNTGWNTKTMQLGNYSGRTIATIGLHFESDTSSAYTMHIGQLAVTKGSSAVPAAPTNFTLDASYVKDNQAELYVSWNFNAQDVGYYELSRIAPNAKKEVIGRVMDEVFYVKSLERVGTETQTKLQLVAVSKDGTRSQAAETIMKWTEGNPDPEPKPSVQVDLSGYFTVDGFSTEANKKDGNYDNGSWSYAADLVPAELKYDGADYKFGSFADGAKNVLVPQGQTIPLTKGKYASLRFLGTSVSKKNPGTFKINYADGTSTSIELTLEDWCASDITGQHVALTLDHRHNSFQGSDQTKQNYIFAYYLTTDPGKEVVSLTLPSDAYMRIMALTLMPQEGNTGVPVSGIQLDQTTVSLKTGDTLALKATVTPEDATDKKVTWSSSAADIVRVDEQGVLTALKAGTATVTAAVAEVSASAQVTVVPHESEGVTAVVYAPESVKSKEEFTVNIGIGNSTDSFMAQDLVVQYAADKFSYVDVKSLVNGVNVLKTVHDPAGKIRLILASEGTDHASTAGVDIISLRFRALEVASNQSGTVGTLQYTLADAEGKEVEAARVTKTIHVTVGLTGDFNHDGKVSIGDLAMMAAHYGKNTQSLDWNQVKKFDMNEDGVIDILDLAALAKLLIP